MQMLTLNASHLTISKYKMFVSAMSILLQSTWLVRMCTFRLNSSLWRKASWMGTAHPMRTSTAIRMSSDGRFGVETDWTFVGQYPAQWLSFWTVWNSEWPTCRAGSSFGQGRAWEPLSSITRVHSHHWAAILRLDFRLAPMGGTLGWPGRSRYSAVGWPLQACR